jgi:hypothetical protein
MLHSRRLRTGRQTRIDRTDADGFMEGCHLFRRAYLRRNTDDERSVFRRHPWSIRRAIWRWSIGLGSRLDRVPHRAGNVSDYAHGQAGRTITDQWRTEPAQHQARP